MQAAGRRVEPATEDPDSPKSFEWRRENGSRPQFSNAPGSAGIPERQARTRVSSVPTTYNSGTSTRSRLRCACAVAAEAAVGSGVEVEAYLKGLPTKTTESLTGFLYTQFCRAIFLGEISARPIFFGYKTGLRRMSSKHFICTNNRLPIHSDWGVVPSRDLRSDS
jgi:hypothetical protein